MKYLFDFYFDIDLVFFSVYRSNDRHYQCKRERNFCVFPMNNYFFSLRPPRLDITLPFISENYAQFTFNQFQLKENRLGWT